MKAVIIGSGEISNYIHAKELTEGADLLICCDGGAFHALRMELRPHIIVGDLDSIDEKTLKYFENTGVAFETSSPHKDFTDMELGLEKAISLGAGEVIFLGATGDRMDHTLSNIQLLYKCLSQSIKAVIADDNNYISLITDKTCINQKIGDTISLLPFTQEVCGITTTGLQYPLNDESLTWGEARGVSNVCEKEDATVDLKSGILILIAPIRP